MRSDIGSIMTKDVVTIEENHTIFDAAKEMENHDISCLLVTRNEKPVGMITEKDMTRRVVGKGVDAKTTNISEVMSSPLVSCKKEKSLGEVQRMFREFGFRRMPIMENGQIVGIVTTTDLANQTALTFEMNAKVLMHQKLQTGVMILGFIALVFIIYMFVRAG